MRKMLIFSAVLVLTTTTIGCGGWQCGNRPGLFGRRWMRQQAAYGCDACGGAGGVVSPGVFTAPGGVITEPLQTIPAPGS